MKVTYSLKSLAAAAVAAATYLVTQTNLSGTAKDIIYTGIVFVATLLPGIPVPASPTMDTYSKPPV